MVPELLLMTLVSTSTTVEARLAKCGMYVKPKPAESARVTRLILEDVAMTCASENAVTSAKDVLGREDMDWLVGRCEGWVAKVPGIAQDVEWIKSVGEGPYFDSIRCSYLDRYRRKELEVGLRELEPMWRAWRSKTGPANLRWGMTPADVKRIFPRAKPKEDDILVVDRAELAEVPARVVLRFARGRLYGADFEALDQEGNRGVTFQDWLAGLTAKYGEHTYANDAGTEYVFQDPETYATLDVVRVFSFGMARVKYQSVDLTRWVQRVERERLEKKAQGM